MPERPGLEALKAIWLVPEGERLADPEGGRGARRGVPQRAGAKPPAIREVARCHREVTERIRIVRRLDFTQQHRIDKTYDEHAQILRAVIRRRADEANSPAAFPHRGEQGRSAQDHAASALHRTRRA